MKTALLALRDTQALLSDRSRWTCGTMARNKSGHKTLMFHENAASWCLEGGIMVCSADAYHEVMVYTRRACRQLYGIVHPWWVNDEKGYDAAMAILARAIELAEADTVAGMAPAPAAKAAPVAQDSMALVGG